MKNKLLTLVVALIMATSSYSQNTYLEVNCQTPGWLSSMVPYGDQQTIQSLKVTGYIDSADLSFIGVLMKEHSLKKSIDLENVDIVREDNIMPENCFNIQWSENHPEGWHIEHIKLPLSITQSKGCLSPYLIIDTISIGSKSMPVVNGTILYGSANEAINSFNRKIRHLIIREGATEIDDNAFLYQATRDAAVKAACIFESVDFPSTLKKIGQNAFRYCYGLKELNLPDSVEIIDAYAFDDTSFMPGTIVLPKNLKNYNTGAIRAGVLVFSEAIEIIDNVYYLYGKTTPSGEIISFTTKEFHIAATTPPFFRCINQECLSKSIVYVPKNSVSAYEKANVWKYATIIAESVPVSSVMIDMDTVSIIKGNTAQLAAMVLPNNADSKSVVWRSSLPNVASVSSTGLVTGQNSGEAIIYATSVENSALFDSCIVKVHQPVRSIQLNAKEKSLKTSETFTFITTINPNDADNRNIIWNSSDPEVVSIDNGTITAVKAGIAIITATSEENENVTDYCEVTVTQPVTGLSLNYTEYALKGIGATIRLEAIVLPKDATNMDVNWQSSNERVCMVSNGLVVAIGYGVSVIIATTLDGGYMATCTITVEESNGISKKTNVSELDYEIYDLNGKETSSFKSGINILKYNNGEVRKVLK